MAVRAGMADLIAELRRMAAAGPADHDVAGVTWWTDQQLQDVIDRHRRTYRRQAITSLPAYPGGVAEYLEYEIPRALRWAESGDGWALRDGSGDLAPAHTINLAAGVITFESDTGGAGYYLDCRAYDLHAAAADVWDAKAGFAAASVDWRSDNHQISASQEIEHCRRQAREYRSRAGVGFQVGTMIRSDEAW